MVALQLVREVDERHDLALRVLVDPPVVDLADRHGVEEVELLPAHLAGDDEVRLLEHPQVLHDAVPRHLQLRLQLGQPTTVSPAADATGSGNRRMRMPMPTPRRPARIGMPSATCSAIGRASGLIATISAC